MSILIVTGTGTGVGKTVVSAAVAALAVDRGASVAYVKAVQTGVGPDEAGDMADVVRLSGVPGGSVSECGRFPDPLSPAAAARVAGRPPVPLAEIVGSVLLASADHSLVVVEGAGGLLVRFDDDGTTLADVARELSAPVLVVCAAGLGTLNHTALTLEALAHRGLDLAGVVIGTWPPSPGLAERCNVRDLETLGARPLAGVLPDGAGALARTEFVAAARLGLAPALGGRFNPRDLHAELDPEGTR